jgi:hypothetical protein
MIHSRQGAVMAQLRRILYCRINLAIALIRSFRPIVAISFGAKPRRSDSPRCENVSRRVLAPIVY